MWPSHIGVLSRLRAEHAALPASLICSATWPGSLLGGLVLALEQVFLRQRVEQRQRGQDDYRGDGEDDEDDRHRRVGGGGLIDAEAGRQQVGELGDSPAPDDGGYRAGGE